MRFSRSLSANGFLDEVKGATLDGGDRNRYVSVRRDKDKGHLNAPFDQSFLRLWSAQTGHAHVKHRAARRAAHAGLHFGKKALGIGKRRAW